MTRDGRLSEALLGLAEGVRKGDVKPTSEEVAALFLIAGTELGQPRESAVIHECGLLRLELRTQRFAWLIEMEAPPRLIERELGNIERAVEKLRAIYPPPSAMEEPLEHIYGADAT